jgi:hypothetical protein
MGTLGCGAITSTGNITVSPPTSSPYITVNRPTLATHDAGINWQTAGVSKAALFLSASNDESLYLNDGTTTRFVFGLAAGLLTIPADGTTTASGIKFGTTTTQTIYRGGAGILRTNGAFYVSNVILAGISGCVGGQAFRGYNSASNDASNFQITFCGYGALDDQYKHGIKTINSSTGANNTIDFYIHNSILDTAGAMPSRSVMSINGDGLLVLPVGGTATGLDVTGYSRLKSNVGCSASRTSARSLTTSYVTIPFNTETGYFHDPNSRYTYTSDTDGYFTAPVAGYYLLAYKVATAVEPSGYILSAQLFEGANVISQSDCYFSASSVAQGPAEVGQTITVYLAANAVIRVKAKSTSGTPALIVTNNQTYFSVHLLSMA